MKKLAFFSIVLVGMCGGILADPIGPDCSSCNGAIYTLSYSGSPISTTATTETFRITLTIDTSGVAGAIGATSIADVAIKVSSSAAGALFSAPDLTWSYAGDGGLNASGCDGSGSGWVCASGNTAVGAILAWIFDVEIPTGTLSLSDFGSEVKARYVDDEGDKIGALTSEVITLQSGGPPSEVPEPTTLILLGTGLLGMGLLRRKSS